MIVSTFEPLSYATVLIFHFALLHVIYIVYPLSSHSRLTTVPVGKGGGTDFEKVLYLVGKGSDL